MPMGIHSEDEDRFLSKMEGVDPPNVSLPLPGSWDLRTSKSWVFLHPGCRLPHVQTHPDHVNPRSGTGSCATTTRNMGLLCIRNMGLKVPETHSEYLKTSIYSCALCGLLPGGLGYAM